jgi:hypothetical protein
VSSQPKKLIGNVSLKKRLFLGLPVWLVLVAHVFAQESVVQYIEYPQILGKVQPLHLSSVPKWVTFDGQLRGRTEDQTSDDYIRATTSSMN